MNDRMQRLPFPFLTRFGKGMPIALLLMAVLLASGCATLKGKRSGDGIRAQPAADRLPFPASRRTTATGAATEAAIEPTVVSYPEYRDPLIWVNRGIFAFNDVAYRFLLIPLGKGYVKVVPDPVQRSVGNFFYNLKMPVYAVNHLLQLEPEPLGRNLLRFGINTTVGLLGLFDPARAWWGLEREETDFEETLARYGAGYGIYLVLPVFGPSDLRGGASLVVDHFLNPIVYLTEDPEKTVIQGYDFFQAYAPGAERYETLRRKSDDPYTFFRNLYLQGVQRDAEY
jgi:phospholipid-binding lipoprotein MlaA